MQTLYWILAVVALAFLLWYAHDPCPKRRSRAERRADALLREVLTTEQYHQLLQQEAIDMPSLTYPQRVYRIPQMRGYILIRENGEDRMLLCLQPLEALPDADLVALHVLMITANEEAYLQQANVFPLKYSEESFRNIRFMS